MAACPDHIDFDIETYSECDLLACGSYVYARHPTTFAHCAWWRISTTGEFGHWCLGDPMPVALFHARKSGLPIFAHNCQFDSEVWRFYLTGKLGWYWPGYDAWVDTQAVAQVYNLPGKLDKAAQFVSGVGKDPDGYSLMLKMCKPMSPTKASSDPKRNHTKENLARLSAYCKQDVIAEHSFISQIPYFSGIEEQVWRSTWRMNRRGVKIDIPFVRTMRALADEVQEHYRGILSEVTSGAVTTEAERKRLGMWMVEHGAKLPLTEKGNPSFSKQTEHLIDMNEADDDAHQALDLYKQLSNSSLAKLDKMMSCVCPDGRIRGMFRYSGAGMTARWAGQDVQLQNLPRGILEGFAAFEACRETILGGATWQELECLYNGNALDVLSTMLRTCFVPDEGREYWVADYSAIEGRVLAWLAGEVKTLKAYSEGKRLYAVIAADIFGCTYEQVMAEKKAGDSYKDKIGKIADLACGFGGSVGAFEQFGGRKMGLTTERMKEIVAAWRAAHKRTVQFWFMLQERAMAALEQPNTTISAGPVAYRYDGKDLMCRLPSGRKLYYHKAHITQRTWPDGGTSDQITYYGVDAGHVGWLNTYGGKLCENVVQATARDLLAHATVNADKAGLHAVMTVHDELVCEEATEDGVSYRKLASIMEDTPKWAAGLPVKAEGFASPWYRKG